MTKRHLTKNEILAKMKSAQRMNNSGFKAAFTGVAVVCNYVLWKDEGWEQEQLGEYNQRAAEYEYKLCNEEVTLDGLAKRILEVGGFPVGRNPYTEEHIKAKKENIRL